MVGLVNDFFLQKPAPILDIPPAMPDGPAPSTSTSTSTSSSLPPMLAPDLGDSTGFCNPSRRVTNAGQEGAVAAADNDAALRYQSSPARVNHHPHHHPFLSQLVVQQPQPNNPADPSGVLQPPASLDQIPIQQQQQQQQRPTSQIINNNNSGPCFQKTCPCCVAHASLMLPFDANNSNNININDTAFYSSLFGSASSAQYPNSADINIDNVLPSATHSTSQQQQQQQQQLLPLSLSYLCNDSDSAIPSVTSPPDGVVKTELPSQVPTTFPYHHAAAKDRTATNGFGFTNANTNTYHMNMNANTGAGAGLGMDMGMGMEADVDVEMNGDDSTTTTTDNTDRGDELVGVGLYDKPGDYDFRQPSYNTGFASPTYLQGYYQQPPPPLGIATAVAGSGIGIGTGTPTSATTTTTVSPGRKQLKLEESFDPLASVQAQYRKKFENYDEEESEEDEEEEEEDGDRDDDDEDEQEEEEAAAATKETVVPHDGNHSSVTNSDINIPPVYYPSTSSMTSPEYNMPTMAAQNQPPQMPQVPPVAQMSHMSQQQLCSANFFPPGLGLT